MLNTYKAMLKGDTLEWSDEAPELVASDQPVPIQVTILDDSMLRSQQQDRGQQMAAALERLAANKGLADILDPRTWQREIRRDRSLPGQDV